MSLVETASNVAVRAAREVCVASVAADGAASHMTTRGFATSYSSRCPAGPRVARKALAMTSMSIPS